MNSSKLRGLVFAALCLFFSYVFLYNPDLQEEVRMIIPLLALLSGVVLQSEFDIRERSSSGSWIERRKPIR